MIVVYAEKEDMGIRYAAALGGINVAGKTIKTDKLSDYMSVIKKTLCPNGYIETFYNNEKYVVTWGWGHFGTLKDIKDYDPELKKWKDIPLPYIPKKFEVKRIENQNEYFRNRDNKQFEIVKKLFLSNECEYIVNATDWEREGELIFIYVYDLTGTGKPYKRLRNTAKTEKEIRKAFNNLVSAEENYPYVVAARARSIADWTIGINMTIAATRFLSGNNALLNVGRVLTPTLALITNRENEILNFKEETHYGISGEFTLPSGNTYQGKYTGDLFTTADEADRFIKSLPASGNISAIEKKTETKRPPLLHNTQSLQVEANEVFGYTLEETLNLAQKLYERGYITYPRVDSQYLTEDKKAEMPSILSGLMSSSRYKQFASNKSMPDRYFNNDKVDGHDAIITTDVLPSALTQDQLNIYELIARRLLMTVQDDMKIEKTTVTTNVDGNEFVSNGTKYLSLGFGKLLLGNHEFEDKVLPSDLAENVSVNGNYSVYEQISKPPQRFTDATLIKAMENCGKRMEDEDAKNALKKSKGIGRPATRAAIMERLIKAEYVERRKKTIYPTEKGMSTIKAITIDEIKSPVLTADWEMALDEIELCSPSEANGLLKQFFASIKNTAIKWCAEMEENKVAQSGGGARMGVNCPCCGNPLVEGRDNYYCSNYKEGCSFSVRKNIAGKNISEAMVKRLVENKTTGLLKSFKSKNGKLFDASIVLVPAWKCPECNSIQPYGSGSCYKDKAKLIEDPKKSLITALKF